MRRVALVFALIALISAALRVVTPERIFATAASVAKAPERFGRAVSRLCLLATKRLRPLLPQAN
jgi:hypothetical protein